MLEKDLDTRFNDAVELASNMSQSELPQDVQLRLYAYYKQATFGSVDALQPGDNLRSAFKTNAWMQISHLSSDEAKERYIEAINALHQ
ncbi:MAG TPA: acyl-CoA-binding protein [Flavobacterium sp.]|nr:acyl-CoA-binding protein [Flavobacterium sp.]